jgi:hypothetical protein
MDKSHWKEFWNNYRKTETQDESDLFFQVGKTVNKNAIPESIFHEMVEDIRQNLNLQKEDVLLEMCCGNGLLSKPLSMFIKELYAFDFTGRFIDVAKRFKQSENIIYQVGDAKGTLSSIFDFRNIPNKYLMNDALGYFTPENLEAIIEQINHNPFDFYITGIPCDSLKWAFYNTEERKNRYLELKAMGDDYYDGIGRWWSCDEFFEIACKFGLSIKLERQPIHISTFRINVLLGKKE